MAAKAVTRTNQPGRTDSLLTFPAARSRAYHGHDRHQIAIKSQVSPIVIVRYREDRPTTCPESVKLCRVHIGGCREPDAYARH